MNDDRQAARDVGILIGDLPVGPNNAITDVPGVRVGHSTLIEGDGPLVIGKGPVRTGVTAILPPGDNWWKDPVEGGNFVINGAGTTAGLSFIDEYHRIETPILLTNTLSVGTAFEGIVRYMVEHCFEERSSIPWFNPVVGETSDAGLNDIGGLHVRPEHCVEAIRTATPGPVEQGSIGGGTAMSALGWKGGIGTSSRVVQIATETATVGVLVQANFGGTLTVSGVRMGDLQPEPHEEKLGASIMIIYATDLPLPGSDLDRVAKRATFGLARTGSRGGHGSGDYVIGFSTTFRNGENPTIRQAMQEDESLIDVPFQAIAEATEEAILNALFKATRLVGYNGNVREALPINRVLDRLKQAGVLK
ncbi:MAG: P1 family peptidase [Gemmatimonadetes bacterium]|nr:P1 family peptidase [Gemmatimonadota bacterium]MBT4609775.1 P1 family peptidase [Gemmatimonadota bacterium]MBT5057393.1 P1 family peptidase [Gemmatimonadota bacterium]MBT5146024.1 P1 family peptidase [Gemmatimonadota bacterium]MBT5591897.1 P1 family peptidase [Gemmatimonadota bacterium]